MRMQPVEVHMVGPKLLSWVQGFRLRSVFLWMLTGFLGCHQSCLSLQIVNNFWDQLPGTCTFRPRTILFTGCWLCPNSICHLFTPWLKPPAVKGYVNLNCVKELSQHMWSPKTCRIVESIAWTLGFTRFEFESWFSQVPAGRCWASRWASLRLHSFVNEMSDWGTKQCTWEHFALLWTMSTLLVLIPNYQESTISKATNGNRVPLSLDNNVYVAQLV